MAYSLDNFLVNVSSSDNRLHLRDSNGVVRWSIDAFDIVSSIVSNNLLKIRLKSTDDLITIDFTNKIDAKNALGLLQSQVEVILAKTPILMDSKIVNYVDDKISELTSVSTYILVDSSSLTFSGNNGVIQKLTFSSSVGSSRFLTLSDLKVGSIYTFIMQQPESGGPCSFTVSTQIKTNTGTNSITTSTASNVVDLYNFIYDGSSIYISNFILNLT